MPHASHMFDTDSHRLQALKVTPLKFFLSGSNYSVYLLYGIFRETNSFISDMQLAIRNLANDEEVTSMS
jgi:hypothetical protein